MVFLHISLIMWLLCRQRFTVYFCPPAFLLISPPSSQRHREEKAEIPPFLFSFFFLPFLVVRVYIAVRWPLERHITGKEWPPPCYFPSVESLLLAVAVRLSLTSQPGSGKEFFNFLVKQHHSIASYALLVDFIC